MPEKDTEDELIIGYRSANYKTHLTHSFDYALNYIIEYIHDRVISIFL